MYTDSCVHAQTLWARARGMDASFYKALGNCVKKGKPGMVVLAYTPSTGEVEIDSGLTGGPASTTQ